MLENTLIFSLSANKDLANKVASALGMEVSEVSLRRFPSGEIIAEPIETVRDKDVYIIQSTCPPVNENLMELLIFVAQALEKLMSLFLILDMLDKIERLNRDNLLPLDLLQIY